MSELTHLQDLIDLWTDGNGDNPDAKAVRKLLGHLELATLKVGYMSQHLETPAQFKQLADMWLWALNEGLLDEPGGLPDSGEMGGPKP